MASITVHRAKVIVGHAEDEFASGSSIDDAFAPFARGGASSRLEAVHALYLVIADFFSLALRGPRPHEKMAEFEKYANLSEPIAIRVMSDGLRDPAMLRNVLAAQETVASFVSYLRRLDPAQTDYWPQVYQRIGLDYPAQLDSTSEQKSSPMNKKPWWCIW
jgi:hypothetical protein